MFFDQRRNVLEGRGVTANLFLRRGLFEQLGGFDESLPSGGDYDLVRRALADGARLAYAPDAVVRHPTLDDAPRFLGRIWTTNRWSGVRTARAGQRPDLWALVTLIPVVGVSLARRRARRPAWDLEHSRLDAAGVTAHRPATVRALLLLYFVIAYVAGVGRVLGWIEGRRSVAAGS